MNEVKELIKRANKYVESAELLLNSGDFDSSISRAYYAMFFAAEALLLTKELKFSSHRGVISAFGQHFVKTGIFPKEMNRWLYDAFEKRQAGDYSFRSVINGDTAKESLTNARGFIGEITTYLRNGLYDV
ncbi:MAG: hypothetical protein MSIBF_01520 [Candidatus Altiarchaeales archaeon IMC4]|nr:MAG: hypothetical protein MSIBF_01520 [Candidatus Altiarchaeales archaeon IMC4]